MDIRFENKKDVSTVCRRCGKPASADSFVLHHSYKMVVCPGCVAEYNHKTASPEKGGSTTKNVPKFENFGKKSELSSAKSSTKPSLISSMKPSVKPSAKDDDDPFADEDLKPSKIRNSPPIPVTPKVVSPVSKVSDKPKPAGWDAEDAYLEKMKKKIDITKPVVQEIDEERVKYTCLKCKYVFVYNMFKEYPKTCPYCKTPVSKF
ncbi:MAG: hypothetical protein KKA51_00800 [Nanoarchaeota archaeon]|nr:hypothetical protein [Nanoarchaeota archaeon]